MFSPESVELDPIFQFNEFYISIDYGRCELFMKMRRDSLIKAM